MVQDIYKEVEKRTKGYDLYTQAEDNNPVIVAKLFDMAGSARRYIAGYSPKEKIMFGYVEWLMPDTWCDEWGYTSLDELASLKYLWIPRIECDIHFETKKFSEIWVGE